MSEELTVQLRVFGFMNFNIFSALLSVTGVSIFRSALLSTIVCAPVVDTRHRNVEG